MESRFRVECLDLKPNSVKSIARKPLMLKVELATLRSGSLCRLPGL